MQNWTVLEWCLVRTLEIPQMIFRGLPLLAIELESYGSHDVLGCQKKKRKLTRERKQLSPTCFSLILCACSPDFLPRIHVGLRATYNHY